MRIEKERPINHKNWIASATGSARRNGIVGDSFNGMGFYVFGQEERVVEAHVDSRLITVNVLDRIDDGDWTQEVDVVVGADALDAVNVLLLFPLQPASRVISNQLVSFSPVVWAQLIDSDLSMLRLATVGLKEDEVVETFFGGSSGASGAPLVWTEIFCLIGAEASIEFFWLC